MTFITENLSKKTPTDFSSTYVHICVKYTMPLITSAQNWSKTAIASLNNIFSVLSDYTHIFNFKMIVFCTCFLSVLLSCPMTSTVPLKSKLTVTCTSILETGDSRLHPQNFWGCKKVSSDWSKFLYCWLWFWQTQTLSKVKTVSAWFTQTSSFLIFCIY